MQRELSVRKTSGRYKLVFLDPNTGGQILILCDVTTGKFLPSYSSVKGLDLPVLDIYILNNFENEVMLRECLANLGYKIPESFVPRIVYKSEGKEKFLELIFKNDRLRDLAILCSKYKEKYSKYATRTNMSSRDLRKIVSREIEQERIWVEFYQQLIKAIHVPDFYEFIQDENLLGDRAFGYIKDYLDNEKHHNREQVMAFESAKYYLKDTFTAYKPIRGMVMCELKYQKVITPKETNLMGTPKKVSTPTIINPLDLLTEEQLIHLESHEAYHKMTLAQKKDLAASCLGLTKDPWYFKTSRVLSEAEAAYLEKHDSFYHLSYFEKIEFANAIIAGEKTGDETPFQKRKQ